MCGIAGLLSTEAVVPERLRRMTDVIAHRGPDDQGVWIDAEAGVGLGHRRLAIIDLSPQGHQPMLSADGRYVITYNAEVYNHAELRRELEAAGAAPPGGWRGHSDTETLLQCVSTWGLDKTLPKIVGMFAFGLWDREERTLSLVRDRFGEKPLYYGWAGHDFIFGSELKALRAHPRFQGEIDRRVLRLFASRSYVPAPFSIYKRLFKVEPGCVLTVTLDAAKAPRDEPPQDGQHHNGISMRRYWSYRSAVQHGLEQPIRDEGEAVGQLERVLARAIQDQSVADVPVGAFLSGGIDSSTIVALYQKYSSVPVRTFSIGFEEEGFDEAQHAKAVAKQLGTVHSERYVTVKEARDVIPLLSSMYDEPFADSSQIPTHLVSRFAREQVTVAMTGDGGDELFGGYNRHVTAAHLWKHFDKLPGPMRAGVGRVLGQLPGGVWDQLLRLAPGRYPDHLGAKVQKGLRSMSGVGGFTETYAEFLDEWAGERSPVIGGNSEAPLQSFDLAVGGSAPEAVRMMYADAVAYLPDDLLCKVDRASMAVSLETRLPYLDHRVAELAARIPLGMKISGGKGKQILRRILYREVPAELIERPKAGFAVPVGEWIRGPLRPWAEELLDPARMASEGYLDPAIVQRRWQDHVSGRKASTTKLWTVLMFQSWLRENAGEVAAAA